MKIAVVAPKGKMGSLIIQGAQSRENIILSGVLAPKDRSYIGDDVGLLCGLGAPLGVFVTDDSDAFVANADVIIDYSTTETSMALLDLCLKHKKPLVCGTTGFTLEEMEKIKAASQVIPLLYAANTSRVVNLMYKLLAIAAEAIGHSSDIEIIEMHDRNKLDAPSGTSKEMGMAIAEALEAEWSELATFGRSGKSLRQEGSIGYHSIRSGDIASSHTVLFGLQGERLEITHHAHNWKCFAEGALDCAAFLKDKEPGYYSVKDVLGL